jgi:hypothetical protein
VEVLQPLDCHTGDDSVLDVAASYSPGDSNRDIRRRAWALIGTIAEPAASVRERRRGNSLVCEVVTDVPDGSGQFASHGRPLRLTLVPGSTP